MAKKPNSPGPLKYPVHPPGHFTRKIQFFEDGTMSDISGVHQGLPHIAISPPPLPGRRTSRPGSKRNQA